ncbi:MAG TPA: GrpB family protein [Steroidobacteraceae bacterium]|nr:GrpB family protein [Steroidobacteraceae bacterium]
MSLIRIVDYDPTWPQTFEILRDRLLPTVADVAIAVEHVGSTAVHGLAAKPILDIGNGYTHRGDLGIEGRESFDCRDFHHDHHLYGYATDSRALRNHLALRDYLRSHQEAARAYGDLKRRLAAQFPDDIASYVEGKTQFIIAVLRQADFASEELSAIELANSKVL